MNEENKNSVDLEGLNCNVCYEKYNNDERKPMNLGCGHDFCFKCVQGIFASNRQCPFDEKKIQFERIEDVPQAYTIKSIVVEVDELNQKFANLKLQNNEILNQLKTLMIEKKKNFIIYAEKLSNHKHSSYCSVKWAKELLEESENKLKDKEDELERLKVYMERTQDAYTQYVALLEKILNYMTEIDDISNKLNDCESEAELKKFKTKLENMKLTDKELTIIEQPIEGQHFLKEFKKLIDYKMNEIEKSKDLIDILEFIKQKFNSPLNTSQANDKGGFNKFKIALIGDAGTGKSSFINRTRKLNDNHENAAKVGQTDTTVEIIRYEWPDNPVIDFYDFPGYGLSETWKDYANEIIDKNPCDYYIYIYSVRLKLVDVLLIKHIWIKTDRKIVIARSKVDIDIKNSIDNDHLTEEKAFSKVKDNITLDFNNDKIKPRYDKEFNPDALKVFAISTTKENIFKFELNDMLEYIVDSLPGTYGDAFAIHCIDLGRIWIEKKRKIFEKRIDKLALLSAVSDLIPIGGVIVDVAIIYNEVKKYLESFGLTAEKIEEYAKILELSPTVTNSIIDAVGIRSVKMHIKNSIATAVTVGSIGLGATTTLKIASTVGGFTVGIATMGISIVAQAAITGPISFFMTRDILKKILADTVRDTYKIFEELSKATVKKHLTDQ